MHKWDFARLFYWFFFVLWYCFIHKEDRVSVALQFQDHKGLDNNILLTQCLDNNPKRILIYSPSIICTFVHKCHHLVYSIFCEISGVLCCWFQCCQLLHMISRKEITIELEWQSIHGRAPKSVGGERFGKIFWGGVQRAKESPSPGGGTQKIDKI